MENIIEEIRNLFQSYSPAAILSIAKIPQSGSIRIYFRITTNEKNFIAAYGDNVKENRAFIYFSRHFKKCKCPVPEIFAVNKEGTIYIQEDFGDVSLLNKLEEHGYNDYAYSLFQKSLAALAQLQIEGDKNLDYSYCITSKEFGLQAILSDLLYFKYYFLDALQLPYDKEKMLDDFDKLSEYLSKADYKYFMFRDFQSRNIMIKNEQPHFIDFQGGMKGALQYDVASMLWQAKASLPDEWKNNLLTYYMDCTEAMLNKEIDRSRFENRYNGYVLIRLMQVLGAYGFRGLFERKAHFLTSIPLGLRNLKWFLKNKTMGIDLPEFQRMLNRIVEDDIIRRFEPVQANEKTPLLVHINSFSYKKGIPQDDTDNGGGFVFDCRGILNPGRIEEFKKLTGRDKPVKDYLEQQTKMPGFLNSVFDIVDITVEDYIKRNFNSLMVSFGCTGGQHRSVYAADALARHLRNKFQVKTVLHHIEQEGKKWLNS
ncbi:MAG: phosphotransferase [Bacteroidetes bacterium]|nr:phosphotransferase [Bacteroidota bacterium]MBS1972916.1 phosphotransferase [Bacteroidota bacterium]